MNVEPTNEANQQSNPDKGKTKITPMSKDPSMGKGAAYESI